MEARNFVAAREMVAGGSWLIPTMNGELRLAKPPLPTWAVAGLQTLIGPTENLALLRLPAAVVATLLVLFFWGLALELTRSLPGEEENPGRTAWLGALALGSSLLVVTTGREGQWDIFAVSLMVGALWLLVKGWQHTGRAWGWLAGAGVLGGLSLLSKGPVALYTVLFPFLLVYLVGYPQHRQQVRRQLPGTLLGLGLLLAIGCSWPLYIYQHVAPAAVTVARTEISSWGERHVKPFWFYAPFAVFTGIWALVALVSLVWPYARPRLQHYIPYVLALGWVLVSLLLLSLVPEKKERYMLPLMPPLALLVAGMVRYWEAAVAAKQATRSDQGVLRAWGIILLVVCLAVPIALLIIDLPGTKGLRFWASLLVFGGIGVYVMRQVRLPQPTALIGASLTGMSALLILLLPFYPLWERRRDTAGLRQMRDIRRHVALQSMRWYSLDTLHVKQVWAAGRAVPIWHIPAGISYALKHREVPAGPVAVFSAAPLKARLPLAWRNAGFGITQVDSFYLGGKRESGYWVVGVLSRNRHISP
ncbi:ArnT family glycosyltransferase [Hymenobacter wooponensis]|nr:glycosyltransferase family 39 protein [Hymenobacter wooponensis]